jgi:hypothetical protein
MAESWLQNNWCEWRLLVLVAALLPFGCAKSQAPSPEKPQIHVQSGIAELWEPEWAPDTLRIRMDAFEWRRVDNQSYDEIWGFFDSIPVCIIPSTAGKLLEMVAAQDLDGDQQPDLLVGELAGDHCCPNVYRVISYLGAGQYHQSAPKGHALHTPQIQAKLNAPIIEIENGVIDPYDSYQTKERFTVEAGEFKFQSLVQPKELPALDELRIAAFDTIGTDSLIRLQFDLDADGKMDRITARYWPRWQRVMWSLNFGNGKGMEDGIPFQRLGVLASTTDGVHDLVVDYDRILVWKGKRYEEKED